MVVRLVLVVRFFVEPVYRWSYDIVDGKISKSCHRKGVNDGMFFTGFLSGLQINQHV